MNRVTHYEATFYNVQSKQMETNVREFTEAHAREANAVLEPNGLNLIVAQGLIRKWNRMTALKNHYRLTTA